VVATRDVVRKILTFSRELGDAKLAGATEY
jgi:hypothetical protein